MDSFQLRQKQEPLKAKYRSSPETALITLKATSKVGEGITCKVETGKALSEAGLHPATGGDGLTVCSGDMLLEAFLINHSLCHACLHRSGLHAGRESHGGETEFHGEYI